MNKITALPLCFLLTLLLVCHPHTAVYGKYGFQLKDTLAKVAADASKSKQGLVSSVGNFFRFRANAQRKEKERVLNIIKGLAIGDSIRISADNLKEMIALLADKQNQHYDTVLALIDSLRSKFPVTTTIQYITTPDTSKSGISDTAVTDISIDEIINKLLPAIHGKPLTEKQEQEKRQTLTTVHNIIDSGHIVYRVKQGVSLKDYSLSIRKQTDFFGFYDASDPFNTSTIPFHLFNWWVYDALMFNGKTGNLTNLNGWDTASVNKEAVKAGCNLAFSIQLANPSTAAAFLRSQKAQQQLANTLIDVVARGAARGINIYLTTLAPEDKDRFSAFVNLLSRALKTTYKQFTIAVTIPSYIAPTNYDLPALDLAADLFIISDSLSIPWFLNQKIPSKKFIFTIPVNPDQPEPTEAITGKFALVKDNKLGGAGILYAGNNVPYYTAWDAMLYKLTAIDTTLIKDSTLANGQQFTLLQRLYRRAVLYNYIVNNPCHQCFNYFAADEDSAYSRELLQYVHDLRIDSIVHVQNKKVASTKKGVDLKRLLVNEFDYIKQELDSILLYLSLFFLLIGIITAIFYIYNLKNKGDDWQYKKTTARILIGITIPLTLFLFSYLFVNDNVPFFGINSEIREAHQEIITQSGILYKQATQCIPDDDCVNISLYTLIGIIAIGGIVGVLTARFLLLPLLKQDDMP